MIEETAGCTGSWLDVQNLMKQAAEENATELAEHGSYQPTLVDEAELSYQALKIGVWNLGQDDAAEARRWLRMAVDRGVAEAQPLLRICQQALEPTPEHGLGRRHGDPRDHGPRQGGGRRLLR